MDGSLSIGSPCWALRWVPGLGKGGMQNCSLALSVDTPDEARRVLSALGNAGRACMPLGPTFFADAFGMTVDRFGVS